VSSNRQRLAARRRNKPEGSLEHGEPLFVAVAQVRRPHGLRGEALASPLTDFPERLQAEARFYLGEDHRPVTIKSRREHNQGLLLAFVELPTREDLEYIRNEVLYARVEDAPPLEEDEYYHHQLIGLEVWAEGERLGTLADILVTGANDVYVVRPEEGKDILLPATSEVILTIDLDKKRMDVKLLPGLIE
jgi:16S rRNA processing protein RimM